MYHIFIPRGDVSWTWVATIPEPVTPEAARRVVEAFRPENVGGPIRMIRVEESPTPKPLFLDDGRGGTVR